MLRVNHDERVAAAVEAILGEIKIPIGASRVGIGLRIDRIIREAEERGETVPCPECAGDQRSHLGEGCPTCHGEGRIPKELAGVLFALAVMEEATGGWVKGTGSIDAAKAAWQEVILRLAREKYGKEEA